MTNKNIVNYYQYMNKQWSQSTNYCIECNKADYPHAGRGLCKRCYRRYYRKTPSGIAERKRYWAKYQHSDSFKRISANRRLKLAYNITIQEKERMIQEQKGLCGSCGELLDKNISNCHVDHSHESGKIRGILCSDCNRGIGCFRDNIKKLILASKYLEKFLNQV